MLQPSLNSTVVAAARSVQNDLEKTNVLKQLRLSSSSVRPGKNKVNSAYNEGHTINEQCSLTKENVGNTPF